MIKRIFHPDDLEKLMIDVFTLKPPNNIKNYHNFVTYNEERLYRGFANKAVLAWDFFIWGNIEDDKYNGYIAFFNDKTERFHESIFQEMGWFSSDQKTGYKLLVTALKFAKEKEFDCVVMSSIIGNPKHKKIHQFYEKMGFKEDAVSYIAKL